MWCCVKGVKECEVSWEGVSWEGVSWEECHGRSVKTAWEEYQGRSVGRLCRTGGYRHEQCSPVTNIPIPDGGGTRREWAHSSSRYGGSMAEVGLFTLVTLPASAGGVSRV